MQVDDLTQSLNLSLLEVSERLKMESDLDLLIRNFLPSTHFSDIRIGAL